MNTDNNILRFIAFITLLIASGIAGAQIQPATLGDPEAEKYLLNFIGFPETHGDASVKLNCSGIVKSSGKLKDTRCIIKNNWDPDFALSIEQAAKKGVLVPAHTEKNNQNVVLQFQAIFLKTGDDRSIEILLNPGIGEMVEEYGKYHISAQRVYIKEKWSKICPRHASWVVFAQAHVDESGVASSVDLAHGGGIVPTGPCQNALIETITSSPFAPAMVDGVAVPSVYVEPFGN